VRRLPKLILLVLASASAGCATIPPEATELSARLGQRVSALEDAHLALLHSFFTDRRQRVDAFVQEQWVPVFAEEFFSHPRITDTWDTVVRENDPAQRLEFIVRLGPRLQQRINWKRAELVAPLDALERELAAHLRAEYDQARAINNTLTSFLASASEVTEARQRYLDMVGVTDSEISAALDETDAALRAMLEGANNARARREAGEKYVDKLRGLAEQL
jgi:hypothetical protein